MDRTREEISREVVEGGDGIRKNPLNAGFLKFQPYSFGGRGTSPGPFGPPPNTGGRSCGVSVKVVVGCLSRLRNIFMMLAC